MIQYKPPLFIGGFPSGGTDLLKNILNAHPDVTISGEMPFLYRLCNDGYYDDFVIKGEGSFRKLKDHLLKVDIWSNLSGLEMLYYSDEWNGKSIQQFLQASFSKEEKKIWGNKTPQNTENISQLKVLFPGSKFIVILRDVRDVALSWRKKWGKNLYLTAAKWNHRMAISEDSTLMIVKYEDLLSSLDIITTDISSFLGIPWTEKFLNYQEHIEEKIDGKINYGTAVQKDNSGKWKSLLSKREIKRIEEIAFSSLAKHNYEISLAQRNVHIGRHEKILGLLKDVLAMIFVGNRASKNNSIIARFKMIYNQIKIRL